MKKDPKWSRHLSSAAWVNSVAISDDASRVVGGSFIHDYQVKAPGPNQWGTLGTFCYDSDGNLLWHDTYAGWDGVFGVAISGDGQVAAGGGWYDRTRGLLRAYDADTGALLLDCTTIPQRVSIVGLSRDGGILAAAADKVYVFVRDGGKYVRADHPEFTAPADGSSVTAVAVHPCGKWLVACDKTGRVLLATLADGQVTRVCDWPAPKALINRTDPASNPADIPFLSVAIARDSESFVVGGGDFVYLFTKDGMCNGEDPARYDTWDAYAPRGRRGGKSPAQNVRWVATSADGSLFTAAVNRTIDGKGTGLVLAYKPASGALDPAWTVALPRNPNGTSMDAEGKHVAVADGYPVGTASSFYLFDADGKQMWDCPTKDMNWPIFISADGTAIAAGGDDGDLYYFEPE